MKRFGFGIIVTLTCQLTYAQPPRVVVESCLLGYPSIKRVTVKLGDTHYMSIQDDAGYRRTWPERMTGEQVGYATSQKNENDYVFIGKYRGYIRKAIPLSELEREPQRIESPLLASYGTIRYGAHRYVCLTQANGQGSAAFVVDGYIGEFPPKKGRFLQLYYTMENTKKFKAFSKGK
ncbi:hypothetical protein [Cupriavidus oxalaticus]|uniref:hypothetical protein n=1 Tax=Cupriavidus oxalaticus TaxID=96344 RepID=UPI00317A5B63